MPIRISPAEWEVLNVLWEHAPATAPEVQAALPDHTDWHQKTVNTFLARLAEKGIVRVKREGKSNVYAPLKTREQCIRAESQSFAQRVFGGAFGPMLLHFVEQAELTPEEIRELERLLKQKKTKL
jgi:BlaI family penicillinase repressor